MAQLAIIKEMSRQEWRGSDGDYQTDEQACVKKLHWRLSGRREGRCLAAQLSIIKQMSRQVSRASTVDYQQMSRQVSRSSMAITKQMSRQVTRGSNIDYQTDEQTCIAWLTCRLLIR